MYWVILSCEATSRMCSEYPRSQIGVPRVINPSLKACRETAALNVCMLWPNEFGTMMAIGGRRGPCGLSDGIVGSASRRILSIQPWACVQEGRTITVAPPYPLRSVPSPRAPPHRTGAHVHACMPSRDPQRPGRDRTRATGWIDGGTVRA